MDVTYEQLDEQLERIHLALGGKPDDGWELIEERAAVELLDQLTDKNRKALLHLAAATRNTGREPDIDFICAVANYHDADTATVAFGWGWTPAPRRRITPQQTIALRLSQFLLMEIAWNVEVGGQPN